MGLSFDIWKMLAGVAIFLLGMRFLEEALQQLGGRSFKLFLKKHTSKKLTAVLGGALVTALLQSSSVVNLMVLAFVGAGVIKMRHALAVILGSNLGSVVSNWIIAVAGFQFQIESIALPLTALGGILIMFLNREKKWYHWSKFLFGFGFMFLGLGFIRTGIEETVRATDLSLLAHQPLVVFILAGLIITSLIQSSSATIAIVLSALHAGAIPLLSAMAIVLGSEVGTTVKLLIASVDGLPVKKRVAWGNFGFNCITATLFAFLLTPVNRLITGTMGIEDPLIALVLFQTLVNLGSIILFFPLLDYIGGILDRKFRSADEETLFIHKVKISDTDLALSALEKETQHLLYHVTGLALAAFEKPAVLQDGLQFGHDFGSRSVTGKYEYIKQLHGDIHHYSVRLQGSVPAGDISVRIGQLIASFRNAMYAAKNIKDAWPDVEQLKKSSNDLKYEFYRKTGDRVDALCRTTVILLARKETPDHFDQLTGLYRLAQQGYRHTLEEIYQKGALQTLSEMEFSTIVNFNREIFTFEKSVVFALKDYLLTEEESNRFDELPGFIR